MWLIKEQEKKYVIFFFGLILLFCRNFSPRFPRSSVVEIDKSAWFVCLRVAERMNFFYVPKPIELPENTKIDKENKYHWEKVGVFPEPSDHFPDISGIPQMVMYSVRFCIIFFG